MPQKSQPQRNFQVGAWEPENQWDRAERARVFLAVCGYLTFTQADKVAARIEKDFRTFKKPTQ
jgi:hypothetical protein